jgi:hypothetical protein
VVAVVETGLPPAGESAEAAEREVPPQVAARLAAIQAKKDAGLVGMTAVVPVHLPFNQHLAAHEACHAAALLWNRTVDWRHAQWRAKESPKKEDIRRLVTSLPAEARPFHAHTAQAIAYDLSDALVTMRENKKAGRRARAPWREKKYRPCRSRRTSAGGSPRRGSSPCPSAAAGTGSCSRCRRSSPAPACP